MTIHQWRIDAGGEFINLDLEDVLKDLSIIVEKSAPYIHQQNGRAERSIRTIMEKAQALRFTACLPPSWWEFCVEHSVHLHNRSPIARLNWQTPLEVLTGTKPDVSHLRIFGCGAYVYLPEEKRANKLAPRSELMTYIGVESGTKGFRFMRKSAAIFIGATATFDETLFPLCKHAGTPPTTQLGQRPTPEKEDHDHSDGSDGDKDDGRCPDQNDRSRHVDQ